MIPSSAEDMMKLDPRQDIEIYEEPSRTYQVRDNKITGHCDGIEAVKQAIYKIINTERYDHAIYSWDYGIETKDLTGKSIYYVIPELKRRITEALMQDDRIKSIEDFSFYNNKGSLFVAFKVVTKFGEVQSGREVTF